MITPTIYLITKEYLSYDNHTLKSNLFAFEDSSDADIKLTELRLESNSDHNVTYEIEEIFLY